MSLNGGPVVIRFESLVNAKIKELELAVSKGLCKSLEEYKKQCGKIEGYRNSLDIMRKSLNEYDIDYDEDDE